MIAQKLRLFSAIQEDEDIMVAYSTAVETASYILRFQNTLAWVGILTRSSPGDICKCSFSLLCQ